MKKKNIYTNQSQELLTLFEEAGNGAKVMCVPIDYAKKDHVVMFCNGYGHILRKPFSIKNSPKGIEYLTEQVTRSCSHRQIDRNHVSSTPTLVIYTPWALGVSHRPST